MYNHISSHTLDDFCVDKRINLALHSSNRLRDRELPRILRACAVNVCGRALGHEQQRRTSARSSSGAQRSFSRINIES